MFHKISSIRSNNSNHPMIFLWKSTNCKTPPNHPDSEVQVGQTLDQLSPKTRWHTGRHWTLDTESAIRIMIYEWIAIEKRSRIKFWFGQIIIMWLGLSKKLANVYHAGKVFFPGHSMECLVNTTKLSVINNNKFFLDQQTEFVFSYRSLDCTQNNYKV